jgi:TM2 domain-containing membrane protein YozV
MKTRTNALLLAFFFGGMGVHKFYLNKPGQGLAYFLFCWTFIPSLIAIGDVLWLALMSDVDFHRRFNSHLLAPVGGYAPYQQAPPGYGPPQAAWQQQPGAYPPPQQPYPAHGQSAPQNPYGAPQYPQGPPQAPLQAPLQAPPQAPLPGSEYHARLAHLEHLKQTGALDHAAYEAAKEELRRAN